MTRTRPGGGPAAWIYAAALAVLPRPMRDRYGAEMRRTFEARMADSAGTGALLRLLAYELIDLAHTAVVSRREPGASPGKTSDHRLRSPMDTVLHDIRYAGRLLARQPGFTLVAVLTLALGIGANTAVFTVVNGILLRPLPFRDPGRLVVLLGGRDGRLAPWLSPLNYLDVTGQSEVFSEWAAYSPTVGNLTDHGDPERIEGADVSWNFFSVLGVSLAHGRPFLESDATAAPARVVVLSDSLWKRRFGGAPGVVGSTVTIDGEPRTVIGIAPPQVTQPRAAAFWEPLVFHPRDIAPQARGAVWIMALARLKPGISLDQANAAVDAVASRLSAAYPRTNTSLAFRATRLHDRLVRNVRPALLTLLAAVALVLLIACVNVANLLLARGQTRLRETAVRAALGAGRGRLVGQFLAESLILAALGSAGGLVVAVVATRGLLALAPASIPRLAEVAIDRHVLLFTSALGIATSVIFGVAPALSSAAGAAARVLSTAGRGTAATAGTRVRRVLVACETALAVMLLIGSGLLIRSYDRILEVNPGFDPAHILTFDLSLPAAKYGSLPAIESFTRRLLDGLAHQGGVVSAAAVFGLPFGELTAHTSFTRRGEADTGSTPSAGLRIVSPGYFGVLRIPLRTGRMFDPRDRDGAPQVAIINEQAARRFWPGRNPIGETIRVSVRLASGTRMQDKTIVGIVGDVKYSGLDEETPPEIYEPYAQDQVDTFTIAVRTVGDPVAFAPTARARVAELDPELPVAHVQPMQTLVGSSVAERRFLMLLLSAFAGVAGVLASIGLYGVLAYIVSQRIQEIGVRLAIGATPADVVRLIVREGAVVAAAGLLAGVAGALAGTRALRGLLFGVTTADPATFAAVAGGLAIIALSTSYLAARRATAVDPVIALRAD